MTRLRPAKRRPRFADGGVLSGGPWRSLLRPLLAGFGLLAGPGPAAERADLSLPDPALPAPGLDVRGVRSARALAHYSCALQFEKAGRMREALEHYLGVLEVDPANPDLAMHAAELAYSFRGRKEAVALLQRAVDASPDVPATYLNLARFCATYAPDDPFENDRAKQALDAALKRFPDRAEVHAYAALTHLSRGTRADALAVLEAAARRNVRDPAYWLVLGRAAQQVWPLGQAETREEHAARVNPFFARALQAVTDPKEETVRLEVAQYYLLSNQLARAREVCERLVEQTGSLPARKLLHRLHDALDDPERALAVLEGIVRDAPAEIEPRRLLANAYEARGELERAVPHLEKALQIGGGEPEDYLALGELLLRAQQFEKVVQVSLRSLKLFPEQPMFHVQAALAQRALQQWPKAIESFRAAAALAESGQSELINHRFYFQYGITLERGGRHDEAGRMLEKAITLTSRDDPEEAANTMNYLGYMWLELDRHLDKAGELILKANELEPDNAAYIDSLGWWHFKKGDYAKAREELQRAVDLLKEPQPDDAEILEHLAQACVRLGDAAKAREWFGKARDLQPTDAKVKARIEEGLKKVSAP